MGAKMSHPSPFLCALACGADGELVEIMLQNGMMNPHWIAEHDSPLNIACRKGKLGAAKVLLKFGANINAMIAHNGQSEWPLLAACKNGHYKLAKFLVDQGGKVQNFFPYKNQPQPIHYTCMDCSQEAGEFLAELLLHRAYFLVVAKDERFSTDRQCEWGTPLRIAMRVGNIRAIATLVSLCGYQILPPIKWVCPTLNTSKTDESAIYRITVFYSGVIQKNTIFCTNSSMDLYEKLWEFEQYRFLEARWNGAAIYPGNQTLYDMGFCSDDVISVSPQKVFFFLSFFLFLCAMR
eukprot:Phypoly_transcript_07569.p1 GENE.Phypoly_transcript_07569~~Phypoly_transcript_07569.p1  ORF type:complete len:293 (+),score=34.09 Phypoly_transcript_07569:421-1299(+)